MRNLSECIDRRARPILRGAAALMTGALLAVLVGCSTMQIGHDYDLPAFQANVKRGVTTQAQVRGWLGAPVSTGVGVQSDGERFVEWIYYYGRGHLPDMRDARLKLLQIRFDTRGIVRAYNWSGGD